ncbi:putative myb-like DNA-binding protein [Phytophthora cinnamomi]|uniref:putative myb-like DNA-binding protein n=1 Tax=Phytophthora cinnamomi TaxID=4785 RepID=UPI00355A041F|nr:putative myb-like DNA-binding protein [Phytophthora cinnamomi]
MTSGTWTEDEHDRFLLAIKEYPRGPWSVIAQTIGTRSVRQVQTHAQKYYEQIMRRVRGLRKDRKSWTRVEHRIDDDILAFCNHVKAHGINSDASPPGVMQMPVDGAVASTLLSDGCTDTSCVTPIDFDCGVAEMTGNEGFDTTCLELDTELDQPLDFDNMLGLPPLEEALDFLISVMEE